jgi:hypothetical protein
MILDFFVKSGIAGGVDNIKSIARATDARYFDASEPGCVAFYGATFKGLSRYLKENPHLKGQVEVRKTIVEKFENPEALYA